MGRAFKNFMDLTEQVGKVFEVGNTIWGFIGKHWKFPWGLDQDVNNLTRKRKALNSQKEDLESTIEVQRHPRKKVKKEVELWLENAGKMDDEIQNLDDEIQNLDDEILGTSSLYLRGILRKNVCKKIEEVEEFLEKGRFSDGLVVDDPSRIGQMLPIPSLVGETIASKRDEILGILMNNEVQKIGIHGMPGVGKTCVIKLVNNELLKRANHFNAVIWVTVSRCSVIELQNTIARAMNAVISEDEEEDETVRAGMLAERLGRKGRYVLILDDVRENFSLEEVGIPEPSNGSKLVLTTRSLDVCRRLDCQVIKMEPLPEADAWTLFLDKVGRNLMSCEVLEPVVRSVAKHCAGLPLAIITIASSMRGEDTLPIWRNALEELNGNVQSIIDVDVKDMLFQPFRFSYHRLKDQKIQKCFLTCAHASYTEDSGIPTEQLIRDWIKRGLMDDMGNTPANLDKGQAILRKLVDNCLLEKVENGRVKMHDLVRDVAVLITHELNSS